MPDRGSSGSSVSSQSSDDESSDHTSSAHPGSHHVNHMSYMGGSDGPPRPRPPLRKGKWSAEEEAYVSQIISDFNKGLLPLPAGTTLRGYLSEKLNCDPMRITKKFAGAACIGKRIFQPCEHSVGTAAEVERAQKSLAELEKRFLDTLIERRRPPTHLTTPANYHRTPSLVRPDVFRDFLVGKDGPMPHPHHLAHLAHHPYGMPHPGMLFHHGHPGGMLPGGYHRPDLMYPSYDDRAYRPPTPASRYAVHPPHHYARPPPHQGALPPHAYPPHRQLSAYPQHQYPGYGHMHGHLHEDGQGCHGGACCRGGPMEHAQLGRQREGGSLAAALYDGDEDEEEEERRGHGESEGEEEGRREEASCDSAGDGPCQCRSPKRHAHDHEHDEEREREAAQRERENEAALLLHHAPRPKPEPVSDKGKAPVMPGSSGEGKGSGLRRSDSSTASLSALAGLSAREPLRCLTQKHGQDTQVPGSSPHGPPSPRQRANGSNGFNGPNGSPGKAVAKSEKTEVEEDAGELLLDFLNSVRRQHHSPPKEGKGRAREEEEGQEAGKRARVEPL